MVYIDTTFVCVKNSTIFIREITELTRVKLYSELNFTLH